MPDGVPTYRTDTPSALRLQQLGPRTVAELAAVADALPDRSRTSALTHMLAVRALVSDVETCGVRVRLTSDPLAWWDVRPMLDEREQGADFVDMNAQSIELGIRLGVLAVHAEQPHLVRVTRYAPQHPDPSAFAPLDHDDESLARMLGAWPLPA